MNRLTRFLPLALLAPVWACSQDQAIHIGLAGPFSQERGTSMRLATELAVREINGRGGVRGRPLALVIHDDSADADRAVAVAQNLYDDERVVAVIGHLTSGSTLAAAPVYAGGSDPLVHVTPSASNPRVGRESPYTFRACPDDNVHGAALAEWARTTLDAERAAVLYLNNDYGRGVRGSFTASFRALGGEVVVDDPYVDGLPGFAPYLRRLQRRGGADVLFIGGTASGTERVLATLDSLNLPIQVMAGDGVAGLEGTTPLAAGMLISSPYLPDQAGARNRAFVETYRAAYGGASPDHRGAGAYDVVYLLTQAIEAVGPRRHRIQGYLAQVGSEVSAFEGVTGSIAFDENGDVPDKAVRVGMVVNRRLTVAGAR